MGIKKLIEEYIQDKCALNDRNRDFHARSLARSDGLSRFASHPLFKRSFLKMAKVADPEKQHTQGWIVPINQGLQFDRDMHNMILPINLVRNVIHESSFRVIMNKCICRTGQQCAHYPVTLGRIFIGEASKVMVKRGIARPAYANDALAHLDRAAELGLICQCLWIEAERFRSACAEKTITDSWKFACAVPAAVSASGTSHICPRNSPGGSNPSAGLPARPPTAPCAADACRYVRSRPGNETTMP